MKNLEFRRSSLGLASAMKLIDLDQQLFLYRKSCWCESINESSLHLWSFTCTPGRRERERGEERVSERKRGIRREDQETQPAPVRHSFPARTRDSRLCTRTLYTPPPSTHSSYSLFVSNSVSLGCRRFCTHRSLSLSLSLSIRSSIALPLSTPPPTPHQHFQTMRRHQTNHLIAVSLSLSISQTVEGRQAVTLLVRRTGCCEASSSGPE